MKTAALDPLALRVLRALYELAELDCSADAGVLGRAVGLRAIEVARVLLVLDARGLVSAEGARLTLAGLAQAVRSPPLSLERKPWVGQTRSGSPLRKDPRERKPRSPDHLERMEQNLRQVGRPPLA